MPFLCYTRQKIIFFYNKLLTYSFSFCLFSSGIFLYLFLSYSFFTFFFLLKTSVTILCFFSNSFLVICGFFFFFVIPFDFALPFFDNNYFITYRKNIFRKTRDNNTDWYLNATNSHETTIWFCIGVLRTLPNILDRGA